MNDKINENINDRIANRVKELIILKKVNTTSLAKAINVPQPRLHRFLERNYEGITVELLVLIANYFVVPLDFFTNKDYSVPIQKDEDYDFILNELNQRWQKAGGVDRGVLKCLIYQSFEKYDEMLKQEIEKREAPESNDAQSA